MKILLSCLVSLLAAGNLAYGSDEPVSNCNLPDRNQYEVENIIAKNVGQQLLNKLSAHLAKYKVGILSETLNSKVSITGGHDHQASYNLMGSVKTTTNQELEFSATSIHIDGVVTADAWNPDGSAINARCQVIHQDNSMSNFSIYNAVTRKVIIKVSTKEIEAFDAYKM